MKVIIIGATSAIAQEVSRIYAGEGASLVLVARNEAKVLAVAQDLRVRGAAQVETVVADLGDLTGHAAIITAAGSGIDMVLVAFGSLPDQKSVDQDIQAQLLAFGLNATSVISIAGHFANAMEAARGGVLVVIGSVAGDRGRRSNYVYGAAKAAIHTYCEGLRSRLASSGVALVLVKPGWVDTPMTRALKKNPLFASAGTVARAIHGAVRRRQAVVYTPWFWRWISLAIRALPARLVKF